MLRSWVAGNAAVVSACGLWTVVSVRASDAPDGIGISSRGRRARGSRILRWADGALISVEVGRPYFHSAWVGPAAGRWKHLRLAIGDSCRQGHIVTSRRRVDLGALGAFEADVALLTGLYLRRGTVLALLANLTVGDALRIGRVYYLHPLRAGKFRAVLTVVDISAVSGLMKAAALLGVHRSSHDE